MTLIGIFCRLIIIIIIIILLLQENQFIVKVAFTSQNTLQKLMSEMIL